MKKSNLLIMLVILVILSVVFFVLKQLMFFYAAATLAFVILIMLASRFIIDKQYQKKLDSKYKLLNEENLEKEFNKIKKSKDEDKIKAFCVVHFALLEKYDDKVIEEFGKYLKIKFSIDPIGYKDGIAIIVVNMHEIMMNEMFKIIKKEMKNNELKLRYKVGLAFYTSKDTFETLIEEAKRSAK